MAVVNAAPPVPACDGSTSATLLDQNRLAGPLTIRVRWFSGFTATDVANCLARVTAHEIGHSLGLFQHSPIPTDLMFGSPTVRAPSSRDRSTVHLLYHSAPDLQPAERP
jgi:predicted Zn-dependent protease